MVMVKGCERNLSHNIMIGKYLFLWLSVSQTHVSAEQEPTCLSRWDYEYKTMKQLLKLETEQEEIKKLIQQQTVVIDNQRRALEAVENAGTGRSTFIHWGQTVCPETSKLIYKGFTAGKAYDENGSGSDNVCLPDDPTWLNYTDGADSFPRARIYGTEIDINEPSNIFPYHVNEQDIPCAVCLSSVSTTIMIPGRGNCYDGWTMEYKGYLMTGYYGNHGSYDHICVDFEPKFVPNGGTNNNQHILYLVEVMCGSLPCPPYVQGREVACVVCSLKH